MRAPRTVHVVEILRDQLPSALGTEAMPGTEGWTLRDVRSEQLFERAVTTLTLACEDHSLRAHLFPQFALREPCARTAHFDLYHRDGAIEEHAKRDRALVVQLVAWLDEALPRAVPVSFEEQGGPRPPELPAPIATLLPALEEGLRAAIASGAHKGLDGWSLDTVAVEYYVFETVPFLRMSRGTNGLKIYLLPRGTEPLAHFRTSRFDVAYDEDQRGSTYAHHVTALEALVAWLEATFPAAPAAS